jgi:hypothetical protein
MDGFHTGASATRFELASWNISLVSTGEIPAKEFSNQEAAMLAEVRNTTSPTVPLDDGHHNAALRLVADPSLERTPEQRVGRAAVVGALIGIAVAIPLFFVVGLITGAGVRAAVVLALFCALWGGPGLGGMSGAVAAFAKEERREAEAARRLRSER